MQLDEQKLILDSDENDFVRDYDNIRTIRKYMTPGDFHRLCKRFKKKIEEHLMHA